MEVPYEGMTQPALELCMINAACFPRYGINKRVSAEVNVICHNIFAGTKKGGTAESFGPLQ